jgi:hypothetical protein
VILRAPRRGIHGDPVALPAAFRAQENPPGMPIGHLDSPPQRLRVLDGFLDMLVGMPWPHHRNSAPTDSRSPAGSRSIRLSLVRSYPIPTLPGEFKTGGIGPTPTRPATADRPHRAGSPRTGGRPAAPSGPTAKYRQPECAGRPAPIRADRPTPVDPEWPAAVRSPHRVAPHRERESGRGALLILAADPRHRSPTGPGLVRPLQPSPWVGS